MKRDKRDGKDCIVYDKNGQTTFDKLIFAYCKEPEKVDAIKDNVTLVGTIFSPPAADGKEPEKVEVFDRELQGFFAFDKYEEIFRIQDEIKQLKIKEESKFLKEFALEEYEKKPEEMTQLKL